MHFRTKVSDSCIVLILANRKYCIQDTSSIEKKLSDYHDLIHSIVKSTFEKEEPKYNVYRDYKKLQC